MKIAKYTSVFALALALTFSACTKIDDVHPEGGTLTASQLQDATTALPERADAVFSGMYSKLGDPLSFGKFSSSRPDDFGFIMMAYSNDVEASDIVLSDNNYNWFSTCCELSSRNADYANPYIRYRGCYDEIGRCHDVMNSYGEITADTPDDTKFKVAQAYAVRAFCYLNLAPYFQFRYVDHQNDPCVPIVTLEEIDYTQNPRATVKEVYDLIISDLSYAIENLAGYERPDKSKIDQQAAYALRARAYLLMGKYAEAAADAEKAMAGYTPSSIEEASHPAFYNINEHNWIWGYDMTPALAQREPYATSSSWLRSFSNYAYSAGTGTYARINNILYNKISESDVRKGWWVNEDLYSPLLDAPEVSWDGVKGQAIATHTSPDKVAFDTYTNVKFGMYTYGGTTNEEDWPFIRVEEMILTAAEGYAMSGNEAKAKELLSDFVKTYRDPNYVIPETRSLQDEIWFQRRVELWGEGFSNADTRRLDKPFVRFHEGDKDCIVPENFRFNLTSNDGWLLLRFCTDETNTNYAIVDNTEGSAPVKGQNGGLLDGVTD